MDKPQLLRPGKAADLAARFGGELATVRARVADYMAESPVVLSTPSMVENPGGPAEPIAQGYRSDGEWIWTASSAQAVREGRVAVPVPFAEKVLAAGGAPRSLAPDAVDAALAAIHRFTSLDSQDTPEEDLDEESARLIASEVLGAPPENLELEPFGDHWVATYSSGGPAPLAGGYCAVIAPDGRWAKMRASMPPDLRIRQLGSPGEPE